MTHRVSIIAMLLLAIMAHASFGCCWHHRHLETVDGTHVLDLCRCDHESPDSPNHGHHEQDDCDESECTFLLNLGPRWDIFGAVTPSPNGHLALLIVGDMGVTPAAITDHRDPANICCVLHQVWRL